MGECWTCGEKGHRSNECTHQKSAMEIGSVEEEELNVGGVWAIAQVQAQEDGWKVSQSRKTRRKESCVKCEVNAKTVVRNIGHGDGIGEIGKKTERDDKKVGMIGRKGGCDGGVKSICAVSGEMPWRPVGSGEITVDSAAEESVCPKSWGEAYQMRKPSRWLRFVNASGGQMGHYGEKTATFRAGGAEAVLSLGFQVSDVQKPLAAVWRIAEKGNVVQFGPRDEDNFIQNVESGRTINMVRKAGSYVIEADYVAQEPGFTRQART